MKPPYDVIIMGGGLAGLTLSIQLKRSRPELTILVLEKRAGEASTAAHKVGESTVELGSHYLRHVIGQKDYLEAHELPKHGLRFFFKSPTKENISSRVELGPRELLPVPSHQLDRGTLENHLAKHAAELGVVVVSGGIAKDVEFGKEIHTVTYKNNEQEHTATARWVADATGRTGLIKRKLEFQKPMEHHVNAVWWRLKGVIDVDHWSDNSEWQTYLKPGLRYLSTVHFMDKGYWLWVIPLGSGNTSIGIVADPAVHPLNTYNTYEKALEWLRVNEPLGYKMLSKETDNLLDFMVLKHYAHHTGRLYSAEERWGVTGEAGAFLDPMYSPGTDFIAMNNSWLSDLILRDLSGEDIALRAKVYEQSHLSLVDFWIPIYQNKYLLMGNTQIMVVKIIWDWAIYWSVTCLLFTNKGLLDLTVLRRLFATEGGVGSKFGALSNIMQATFLKWMPHENEIFANRYIDVFDLRFMQVFQKDIEATYEPKELLDKIADNMIILEQFAVALFRLICSQVKGTDMDLKINPYKFDLDADVATYCLPDGSDAIEPTENMVEDANILWLYQQKEMA